MDQKILPFISPKKMIYISTIVQKNVSSKVQFASKTENGGRRGVRDLVRGLYDKRSVDISKKNLITIKSFNSLFVK